MKNTKKYFEKNNVIYGIAYKYSKNYIYLKINHENGKFTYSFNRSYYYSKEKIRDYFFKGELTVLEQNLLELILNTRTE